MPESHVCLRNSVIQDTIAKRIQGFRIIREGRGEIGNNFFGIHIGACVPFKFNLVFI